MSEPLLLNDDRLFGANPTLRGLAREIYSQTKTLPILSPHGHVPPVWLADDVPFPNPTALLITPDHYINRILHAGGIELSHLGVGQGDLSEAAARAAFRTLCEHWSDFDGTAMRYWLVDQLVNIFGVTKRPSKDSADEIYDQIAAWTQTPEARPKALMDSFNIEFLATTDDPCDDLHYHAALAADTQFSAKHRVTPTFRPDRYLEPGRRDWNQLVDRLGNVSGCDVDTLAGFTAALENRRAYFAARGGVSTDHAHTDVQTLVLEPARGEALYRSARAGTISDADATVLRRHLLTDQMRMACDDGLTMTLHPGVWRDHDANSFETYGPDTGADIPISVEWVHALHVGLNRFGNHPNFKLVLFTIDETTYSREIAPLAGWYRAVHIGVPWWFIDAPESILRFKRAVTEMAGFSRISGMIDDTRAFCSIPARHDMMRRLDAVHLAGLVAEHRLELDEATAVAIRLTADNPRRVFHLDE